MSKALWKIVALGGPLALLAGCGPQISRDELGEVIFEVPKFEEDRAYQLPDLSPTPAGAAEAASEDQAKAPAG